MIIKRRFLPFVLCLTLLMLTNNAGVAQDLWVSFDSGSEKSIKRGVINQQIWIMPQLNKLNFGLGRFDNHNFYYEKSLSKIFFQDHKISARVTDVDFNDTDITLKLFHPVLGIGIIAFIFNEDIITQASNKDIQEILLTTLGDVNHQYVFCNPNSRRYHLYSCLHSEEKSNLIRMSKEDAEDQGYEPGGFCFKKVVYLPDLAIEMEIEKHWLMQLREHSLFMEGSRQQELVNRLGHRIIDNWPSPLLGYNYSFHVFTSQRLATMAIPTGKIFISTALIDALESEDEIEALLVRAIAHIENRHSLKQYYLKTNAIKNKQFIQRLTMATGSLTGIIAGPGAGAIKALGNIPFHLASDDKPLGLGFDDDYENVADTEAAIYLDLQAKDKRHLSSVIRKLQLANLYFNTKQKQKFNWDTVMNSFELDEMAKQLYLGIRDKKKIIHLNKRAKRAENIKFKYFNDDNHFVHQIGRFLPVQMQLRYQSIFENENKLVVYLNDKSLLHEHGDFHNRNQVILWIIDKHGGHQFKLLKKFTTEDMWGARLTFEAENEKPDRFLEEVEDLKVVIVESQGTADKGNDPRVENFVFVKGGLDSKNRMAERQPSDS